MASDLYGIERLKGLCEESVIKGLRVDNAAGLLQAADDQHAGRCGPTRRTHHLPPLDS